MSRPLAQSVGQSDLLSRLQAHAGQLLKAQKLLEQQLPIGMARACRVANLGERGLVVFVDNAAVGARLRQMAPSLLERLAAKGLLADELRVRVRPPEPVLDRSVQKRTIAAPARAALQSLTVSLPADSPLRAALLRLQERAG